MSPPDETTDIPAEEAPQVEGRVFLAVDQHEDQPPSTPQPLERRKTLEDFFVAQRLKKRSITGDSVEDGRTLITAHNGYKGKPPVLSGPTRSASRKRPKREETVVAVCDTTAPTRRPAGSFRTSAKLSLLPSVPIDVLLEIFSHLPPLSLLYVARTSKFFRSLLLNKNSTTVWKSAMANMDCPSIGCPEDVSLPKWAALVWENVCQNCSAQNVRNVHFLLRVRLCRACAKLLLYRQDKVTNDALRNILAKHIPFGTWPDGRVYCILEERSAFLQEMLEKRIFIDGAKDVDVFFEEKANLLASKQKYSEAWTEWHRMREEARDLEVQQIRTLRSDALREKLHLFKKELEYLDKLEAGECAIQPWPKVTLWADHNDVKNPRPLTNRIWQNISSTMTAYMLQVRALRLQDEEIRLKRSRRATIARLYADWRRQPAQLSEHPPNAPFPGAADILDSAPMKSLVEARIEECMSDEAVLSMLNSLWFTSFIRCWKHATTYAVSDIIDDARVRKLGEVSQSLRDLSYQRRLLQYATTVFTCTQSQWDYPHSKFVGRWYEDVGITQNGHTHGLVMPEDEREWLMWFPEYIFHPCNSIMLIPHSELRAGGEHKHLHTKEFHSCRKKPWDASKLKFHLKASKCVESLLRGADLPMDTTTKTMDCLDLRFACLKCSWGALPDGQRKMKIFAWRDAVQHVLKKHLGDFTVKWYRLSDSDVRAARSIQETKRNDPARNYPCLSRQKKWRCVLCLNSTHDAGPMDRIGLKRHFAKMQTKPWHNVAPEQIVAEQENKLFYRAFEIPSRGQPNVEMILEATPIPGADTQDDIDMIELLPPDSCNPSGYSSGVDTTDVED